MILQPVSFFKSDNNQISITKQHFTWTTDGVMPQTANTDVQ